MVFRMKKMVSVFLVLGVLLCGCQKEEDIKQYWVSVDSKYSLSFDEDNTVVIDGKYIGNYKTYSEGKMAINLETDMFDEVLDLVMSAEYTINDGTLTIKDLESGEVFEYYTPEKAELLYKDIPSNAIKGFRQYDFLGYFEGQDFWVEFDWAPDVEILRKMRNDAETVFVEKVIPFYEKTYPGAKYSFSSESVIGVNGKILNGIELYVDEIEMIYRMDGFAIDPEENLIYIYDISDDAYKLWRDGQVIVGKSLLKEM